MRAAQVLLPSLLLLASCSEGSYSMEITSGPERVDDKTSNLFVPLRCPIYTPSGADIPQLPFPSPILFGCGVDSFGGTHGLVASDLTDLAVLTGGCEIGVFLAFDRTMEANPPTVTSLDLDGSAPKVRAWSAPDNAAMDPDHCCPEADGSGVDRRIPITVVALGASGMLLSLGQFDRAPTQVAVELDLWERKLSWIERFYVNGPPPLTR